MKTAYSGSVPDLADEDPRELVQRSGRQRRRIWRNPRIVVSGTILIFLIVIALGAGTFAPTDPLDQSLRDRLGPPGSQGEAGIDHVLGTDQLGRDVLSRLIYGSRVPLIVGFFSAALGALIGLCIGLPAGFYGRGLDVFATWLTDFQLSLPFVLVALAIVALFGPTQTNIILAFALTSWGTPGRVARSSAIQIKRMPFIEAARALGVSEIEILLRHVLPNALGPVLVVASVQVAEFIVFESALGFFGLGVPPPAPTWGNMLADARGYLGSAWWLGAFPGMAIAIAALAANTLGDGLRDVLDPRGTSVALR